MTRQGWAERKVDAVDWADRDVIKVLSATLGLTADEAHILAQNDEFFALTMRIRAEHRRAVRVVKKHFPDSWLHPYLTGPTAILPRDGAITPKHVERLLTRIQADILAALQRGR